MIGTLAEHIGFTLSNNFESFNTFEIFINKFSLFFILFISTILIVISISELSIDNSVAKDP